MILHVCTTVTARKNNLEPTRHCGSLKRHEYMHQDAHFSRPFGYNRKYTWIGVCFKCTGVQRFPKQCIDATSHNPKLSLRCRHSEDFEGLTLNDGVDAEDPRSRRREDQGQP